MGTWANAKDFSSSVISCSSNAPNPLQADSAKVNYVVGLLRGQVLIWAQALSTRTPLDSLTFDDLEAHLKAIFDCPNYESEATERLLLRETTC